VETLLKSTKKPVKSGFSGASWGNGTQSPEFIEGIPALYQALFWFRVRTFQWATLIKNHEEMMQQTKQLLYAYQ